MADRIPAMRKQSQWKTLAALLSMIGLVVLAGCESVPMPDMSKFDFSLQQEKPVVVIKPSYSKVNIRPTPSTLQPPVATLKGGDKLELLGMNGDWFRVGFYDTTGEEQVGWIYKYLLEGYDKPRQSGTATASPSSSSVSDESAVVAEPLEVEPLPDDQELPKSESVSPM